MSQFHEILHRYWGYKSFRSLQEEIIQSVYEGKDTLGLMPTGGGKSLTFQVPAMLMEGLCVVVTPLIALMKDQVDNLRARGIKATCVHSGMSRQENITALENCVFGDYKFLYVSPERLKTEIFLCRVIHMNVCLIVVDESHCISQWGYDFRPSYLRIADLRSLFPEVPILALTATATADVIDDIQEKLHFKEKNVFRKSFERENLCYVIRKTNDKIAEIKHILKRVPGSAIVYVRNRQRTKEIADELNLTGFPADYFHAGLTADDKERKQNNWKEDRCRIIVSTNAFGMGIDKADVRLVIHFELPNSLEEYFQEAGRAGRDGNKSYAVALYAGQDSTMLKRRIKDTFPEKDFVKDVYEKLAYYYEIGMGMGINTGHNFVIEEFCRIFHYNMTHVHSALKLLDLSEYIEYIEDTDRHSKLIFTTNRDDLYHNSGFEPDVENLIQVLLRSYTGLFSDYIYINELLLAQRSGLTHQRVYEILKFLTSIHIIHYIPARKLPLIYYTQNREELKHMNIPGEVYEERKAKLTKRIEQVLHYATSETNCRNKILLSYFGEDNKDDCGHCDTCLDKKNKPAGERQIEEIIRVITTTLTPDKMPVEELIASLPFEESDIFKAIRYLADTGRVMLEHDNIYLNTK